MQENVSKSGMTIDLGENQLYLIAVNLFDSSGSKLLGEASLEQGEQLQPAYDLSEFVGKGYAIYLCEKLASVEAADDTVITLDAEGSPQAFEVSYIVETFPLIEGMFTPGIYEIWEQQFYALDTAAALSEAIENDPNLFTDEYKIVCHADAIELIEVPGGEKIYSLQRHPYSFFDVFCPICQQRIYTGEKSQEKSDLNRYDIIEKRCAHFIGHSVWEYSGYASGDLEEHGMNYKLENEDLYFEVAPGQWQKAIIYNTPDSPSNCYWSSDDLNIRNDFFFLERC